MLMLEMQINLGRAVRENDRLSEELAKKGGNESPIVPPGAEPAPEKKEE
jgi:hypothetical protein